MPTGHGSPPATRSWISSKTPHWWQNMASQKGRPLKLIRLAKGLIDIALQAVALGYEQAPMAEAHPTTMSGRLEAKTLPRSPTN